MALNQQLGAMTKVILLKNKTVPFDAYEKQFSTNGFEPIFVPLIHHSHIPNEALSLFQDLEYLKQLKYLIVTSQRTVECLNESILPYLSDVEKELLLNKTVYTVGPATSLFLERSGFKSVKGGVEVGNGSLLADLIIEKHENEDIDHFLFLVGEIRRDIIPKKLKSKGLEVKEVVTYKTENLDDGFQTFQQNCSGKNLWVVLFSPQGTEEIVDFLKVHPEYKLASIGPTTEQYLIERGITPHVVSKKPEAISLCKAIKEFK